MKKSFRKKSRKILSSIGMAFLVVSTSAISMSEVTAKDKFDSGTFKAINQNPDLILKNVDLDISDNFDYIDELNKQYSENFVLTSFELEEGSMNEGAVYDALVRGDYEAWLLAVQDLEEVSDFIEPLPKEEFLILRELRINSPYYFDRE